MCHCICVSGKDFERCVTLVGLWLLLPLPQLGLSSPKLREGAGTSEPVEELSRAKTNPNTFPRISGGVWQCHNFHENLSRSCSGKPQNKKMHRLFGYFLYWGGRFFHSFLPHSNWLIFFISGGSAQDTCQEGFCTLSLILRAQSASNARGKGVKSYLRNPQVDDALLLWGFPTVISYTLFKDSRNSHFFWRSYTLIINNELWWNYKKSKLRQSLV